MKTTVALLLVLLSLSTTAQAQQRIGLGQSIQGKLDSGSLKMEDGSFYDMYRYDSPGNETIRVTLTSTDFDAYLVVGTLENGEFTTLNSDDDGAGGTDSQLDIYLATAGTYHVRANALSEGEMGDYMLRIETSVDVIPTYPTYDITSLRQITVNARGNGMLNGQLTSDSPMLDDESHYEDIIIIGEPGTTMRISLISEEFDAYLQIGEVTSGTFESLASNDDCEEEDTTNSCLTHTFEEGGTYIIRVNTLGSGETGVFGLFIIKE